MSRYPYREPYAGYRCEALTKAGKPCRAWRLHDEPRCVAHSERHPRPWVPAVPALTTPEEQEQRRRALRRWAYRKWIARRR